MESSAFRDDGFVVDREDAGCSDLSGEESRDVVDNGVVFVEIPGCAPAYGPLNTGRYDRSLRFRLAQTLRS